MLKFCRGHLLFLSVLWVIEPLFPVKNSFLVTCLAISLSTIATRRESIIVLLPYHISWSMDEHIWNLLWVMWIVSRISCQSYWKRLTFWWIGSIYSWGCWRTHYLPPKIDQSRRWGRQNLKGPENLEVTMLYASIISTTSRCGNPPNPALF